MAELSYSQCYLYSFDFDLSLDSYPLRISDTAVSCDELPYVEYEDVISNQGVLNKDVYAKEGEKQVLRHTHASLLIFAGVSIASVSRRLGHASMITTQKHIFI